MNLKPLEQRHLSEKTFHDSKFSEQKEKDYYDLGVKRIISDKLMDKLGDLSGKKAVDFGCGSGWQTRVLLSKGANVWAFDISNEAVKKTRQMVTRLKFEDRVCVDQMPAEKLSYEDNKFDIVVGNAILHHLHLNTAINEIHRVLKTGGKAYFLEPLGHNPLINIYRKLTPQLRTSDEVPLRFEHFEIVHRTFAKFEHEEYYFTTLLAFFWYFVIRQDHLFLRSTDLMFKLDSVLLQAFPFLKKYCWYSILTMQK